MSFATSTVTPTISPRRAATADDSPQFYHHNPYSNRDSKIFCLASSGASIISHDGLSHCGSTAGESPKTPEEFPPVLPEVDDAPTHTALAGRISFCRFPANNFSVPTTHVPKEQMCRLFIGQLPYAISDASLSWVFLTLCHAPLFYIERIIQWKKGRQPSGCVHAYCFPQHQDAIMSLDQKILFDDQGVWFAANDVEQQEHLKGYCAFLAANREQRPFQRPYQMMRLELATSTYRPGNFPDPRGHPQVSNRFTASRNMGCAPAHFSAVSKRW